MGCHLVNHFLSFSPENTESSNLRLGGMNFRDQRSWLWTTDDTKIVILDSQPLPKSEPHAEGYGSTSKHFPFFFSSSDLLAVHIKFKIVMS